MSNPLIAILTGIAVILIAALLFWPDKGFFAIIIRFRSDKKRIQLEDALKFLFDCEYKKIECGFNSLVGHLNIRVNSALKLVERLRTSGLLEIREHHFSLSDTGKEYAIRVIRKHRLWEKYLADETGIDYGSLHSEADKKEHSLAEDKANRLAIQMGNPVYDPHGDPIPSPGGDLPPFNGSPLSSFKEGDIALITHIEDEPESIYRQINEMDLYPGVQVHVRDNSNGEVHFAANGKDHVLTSLFASYITLDLLPDNTDKRERHIALSTLKPGEQAEVTGISQRVRGTQRRRLMDLGIIPGALIKSEFKSATGDPTAYEILGTIIAIRKKQSEEIYIKKARYEGK